MPIATTVNDGEVSLALPHAEPDDLEDNVLVIVNAQAIVPWYKQKKFFAKVVLW